MKSHTNDIVSWPFFLAFAHTYSCFVSPFALCPFAIFFSLSVFSLLLATKITLNRLLFYSFGVFQFAYSQWLSVNCMHRFHHISLLCINFKHMHRWQTRNTIFFSMFFSSMSEFQDAKCMPVQNVQSAHYMCSSVSNRIVILNPDRVRADSIPTLGLPIGMFQIPDETWNFSSVQNRSGRDRVKSELPIRNTGVHHTWRLSLTGKKRKTFIFVFRKIKNVNRGRNQKRLLWNKKKKTPLKSQ